MADTLLLIAAVLLSIYFTGFFGALLHRWPLWHSVTWPREFAREVKHQREIKKHVNDFIRSLDKSDH